MKKILMAATAGFALLGWAGSAGANVVTTGSSTFTITDTVSTAITGGPAPLSADVTFSNFAFTATTFTMSISIANNTTLFPSGRLTAVGFNIDPNATSVTDTSGIFDSFIDATFPSFQTVDVCSSTGSTCAGGGGGDLAPGATNSFVLTLTGNFAGGSIDLGANSTGVPELFDFKWQTGIGSFESQCTYGGSCGTTQVPEPVSILLLGSGLLGLGLIRRHIA
jgi:hypothetical protein